MSVTLPRALSKTVSIPILGFTATARNEVGIRYPPTVASARWVDPAL